MKIWKAICLSVIATMLLTLFGLVQYGEPIGATVMAFGGRLRAAGTPVLEHLVDEGQEVVVMQAPPIRRGKDKR